MIGPNLYRTRTGRPDNVSHGAGIVSNFKPDRWSPLVRSLNAPNRYATDGSRSNGSEASSSSARAGSPAFAGTTVRRRGRDGEEAELDGGVADRRRRLSSSTSHQQQLQRRPESPGTRRRTLPEIGRFRGREEERGVGIGCGECVLLLGVDGGGFIGAGGRGQGQPEGGQCGGPGRVQRPRRARRSRGRAGGFRSRLRRAVGRYW
jgi:hypothetical protein